MNKIFKAGLISIVFIILMGCSENGTDTQTDEEIADDLWQQLLDESYNTSNDEWTNWPGKTGKYTPDTSLIGDDPHLGPQAFQTFINSKAAAGIYSKSFPLVNKSIVVKENYTISGSDTTLVAITAMLKKQGYDAEDNDWFWVKYNPDGTIAVSGKVPGCIGCHGGANTFHDDTDYLWTRIP